MRFKTLKRCSARVYQRYLVSVYGSIEYQHSQFSIFKKEHENWISLDGQKALVRNGSGNILYDINLNGKQITNVRDVLNNAEMLQLNLDKDAYPMNIFSRVEAPSLVEFLAFGEQHGRGLASSIQHQIYFSNSRCRQF